MASNGNGNRGGNGRKTGTKKLKVGRPPIIKTPKEFDEKVEAYRRQCEKDKEPLTFTGMALSLGFCDRRSLYDYADRDGFSHSVRKARSLVEHAYEMRMLGGGQVAGAIFALKNHGWSDRQELSITNLDELTDEQLAEIAQGRMPAR